MCESTDSAQKRSITHRLKLIRETLALSQREFSVFLGFSKGYVSDVENGRIPASQKYRMRIEHMTGCDLSWLETGQGVKFERSLFRSAPVTFRDAQSEDQRKLIQDRPDLFTARPNPRGTGVEFDDFEQLDRDLLTENGVHVLDVLEARRPDGEPKAAEVTTQAGELAVPVDVLVRDNQVMPNCAAVRVGGPGMERLLREGDYAIVNTKLREVSADACYAIRIFDQMLVRYLRMLPSGDLEAYGENPSTRSFCIKNIDLEGKHIEVVGRVIGAVVKWP